MESPWALAGSLFAAAIFGVLVWLILGPVAGIGGFLFILVIALAPLLLRRR